MGSQAIVYSSSRHIYLLPNLIFHRIILLIMIDRNPVKVQKIRTFFLIGSIILLGLLWLSYPWAV